MKKKNGFIATSLIYSFFLIFITLFLTIIADYLQDRVLLNTIEDGIKTDLNSQMTINDFDLGDYVTSSIPGDNVYVVAKINLNNDTKELVLYEIYTNNSKNNWLTSVPNDNFAGDILDTIDDTTKDKILYLMDNKALCTGIINSSFYSCSTNSNYQRQRYVVNLKNINIKKTNGTNGTIMSPFILEKS